MSPSPRAALVVGLAAVLALVHPLLGAAWLIASIGAVVYDASRVREAPTATRTVAGLVVRGQPAPLQVSVSGSSSAATPAAELRQAVPRHVRIEPDAARSLSLETSLLASRRGRHVLPPVAVRVTGPWGIGRWTHHVGGEREVVVYPDVPAALRLARSLKVNQFDAPGGSVRGPFGLGTDLEAVRDYLPDDDIRLVNWRATARLDRPMTNQFRVEQSRAVVLALDTGRLMAAPLPAVGDRPAATRLDLAVDAAVAVGLAADALGDLAGVVVFDDQVRRLLEPRHRGGDRVIRAVFDLEPTAVDSDYERAFHALSGGKRKVVMLWTDLLDEAAVRPLLEAVPIVVRRHAVIVCAVTDPVVEAAVAEPASEAEGLYRAAAAADLLTARARAVTLLRRSGAVVVESRPEALSATSVRAYLRAKASARA